MTRFLGIICMSYNDVKNDTWYYRNITIYNIIQERLCEVTLHYATIPSAFNNKTLWTDTIERDAVEHIHTMEAPRGKTWVVGLPSVHHLSTTSTHEFTNCLKLGFSMAAAILSLSLICLLTEEERKINWTFEILMLGLCKLFVRAFWWHKWMKLAFSNSERAVQTNINITSKFCSSIVYMYCTQAVPTWRKREKWFYNKDGHLLSSAVSWVPALIKISNWGNRGSKNM